MRREADLECEDMMEDLDSFEVEECKSSIKSKKSSSIT
jgi:hypothetical protein